MGKYGKKNTVSKKAEDYSLYLLGESGIGKTTTLYRMCEKLVGEDGYIFLDMGKEEGSFCIDGIVREPIDSWKKFDDVIKDIIKNKKTDYPDLKIVVFDTLDQLIDITEPEVVRRYNQEHMGEKQFKQATTINAAYGGFQKGQDVCVDMILNKIWDLKAVGVTVWMCGHTKNKDVIDPYTEQTYTTISANLTQKYFNAFKTKFQVVGMAVIDRDIITESTGRKNIVTNKDITKNKIVSEARKIVFRNDNFSVDSKSRLEYIVDEIPLDADAFINAIKKAIESAVAAKKNNDKFKFISSVSVEETPVEEKSVSESEVDSLEEEPVLDEEDELVEEETSPAEDTRTDDEIRAAVNASYKKADAETKKKVKEIISSYGKLVDVDRDGLLEILELF